MPVRGTVHFCPRYSNGFFQKRTFTATGPYQIACGRISFDDFVSDVNPVFVYEPSRRGYVSFKQRRMIRIQHGRVRRD